MSNGFTEIDVDKMDYFIRDGHGLGLQSYFDWRYKNYQPKLALCLIMDQ